MQLLQEMLPIRKMASIPTMGGAKISDSQQLVDTEINAAYLVAILSNCARLISAAKHSHKSQVF